MRHRLRVCQIVTTLARGGAQATVLASSDRALMSALGVEVTVLAGPDDTGEGSFWGDPVTGGVDVGVVPDLVRSIRPAADARALRWLVARFRAERPDVVHTHSSKAGVLGRLAARIAGVPSVHTVHGWGPIDSSRGPVRGAAIALERGLARWTAALVVVGEADRRAGMVRRIGDPGRYHLIRSGIELPPAGPSRTGPDRPGRPAPRDELGLGDRFVVGMVGRLAAQKDQAVLIEALARLAWADATLVLVGDGPRRAELEELAAARPGLDVRFLGARPDGARLVAAFDVAVNASRWEGLPRTVVEAAAAGVPVVASDVGGTGELIEPGRSGWLVPAGDAEALALAIGEARNDPVEAAARAARAAGLVPRFSADRMRQDLVALWSEVAGIPSDRRAAPPVTSNGSPARARGREPRA